MDTKEAIEWIFDVWHEWENIYGCSVKENLKSGKKLDEVIELLKQGKENKKYKAIVEEFKKVWGRRIYIFKDSNYISIINIIDELQQKHFPKPVKKSERINNIIVRLSVYNSLGKMTEIIELLRELREEEADNET